MLEIARVVVVDVVVGGAEGGVGIDFDGRSCGVAIFGDNRGGAGVFLVVIDKKLL